MRFFLFFVAAPFLMWAPTSHAAFCVTNKETLKITCSQSGGGAAANNMEQVMTEQASVKIFEDCEAQIAVNKKFEILKGKIVLYNTSNQPTEILASTKIPSNKEKVALSRWVEEQKLCSAPAIEYYNSQSPEVGAIFEQGYDDLFISAADLYQGKITYGDFARASVRRHQDVRNRIAVVTATRREKQAEKAQREATARQQTEDRQRYIQQQNCESLRQQILVAVNSEPTPYQIRQQERARQDAQDRAYAEMELEEQSSLLLRQGGRGLGDLIGSLLGAKNPEQQGAEKRKAALIEQTAIYQRECQ